MTDVTPEFGSHPGDLAEQIRIRSEFEVLGFERASRILDRPGRSLGRSAELADFAQLRDFGIKRDVGAGCPQRSYEFPLEPRLGRVDDHRACWQATLGVEVFEPPVRRLAGADRMTDWRAQGSGWLELDNFRHQRCPLPLCCREYSV